MIEYAAFATVLSLALVALYGTLAAIAWRRATHAQGAVESVVIHARRIEGPVFSALLLAALLLTISGLNAGSIDGPTVGRITLGAVRGILLVVGLTILGWYWSVRETWT